VSGYSPPGASGLFLGLDDFAEVRALTETVGPEYGTFGCAVDEQGEQIYPRKWNYDFIDFARTASRMEIQEK